MSTAETNLHCHFARHAALVAALAVSLLLGGCDVLTTPEERMERAREATRDGAFGAASIDLRKVLDKEPRNTEARLLLASSQLRLGDARGAQTEIKRAIRQGATPQDTARLEGEIHLALGEARQLLERLDNGSLKIAEADGLILRGKALSALGQAEEALAVFEKALAADPDSIPARVGHAAALAALGRADEALAALASVLETAPATADARLLETRILMRRGQFAQAEAALARARDLPPGSLSLPERALVLGTLAEAQLGQGKIAAAQAAYDGLVKVSPEAPLTRLLSARIALAKGEYPAAIAELQRLIIAMPDLLQARMLLGAAHFSQDNLVQAESVLAELVQTAPDNIEARTLLARARLKLGKADDALNVLTPALAGNSQDSQFYSTLADAYARSGKSGLAVDTLEHSVRANPKDDQARLDLAQAYIATGKPAAAIQLLEAQGGVRSTHAEALLIRAIGADRGPREARAKVETLVAERPRDAQLLQLAAAFFATQGEHARSRELLQQLLKQDPKSGSALRELAQLDVAAGNVAAAEKNLQQALALDDSDTSARLALAGIAYARGDILGALKQAAEAARLSPAQSAPHFALARIYLSRKDGVKARTELDAAIEAERGRADAFNAAGMLLLDAQRYDEALERFRKGADLEPSNALYWLNTGRAQLALNKADAARESLDRALELRPDWMPAVTARTLLDLRASGVPAALARAQQVRSRHPKDPEAIVLEGDVLMAARKPGDAARVYADAERVNPDAVLAVKTHQALKLAGAPRPEQPLVRWLSLRPDDGRVRNALAEFYVGAQRRPEAIAELETVARQTPNDPAILNNLAWLYHQQGDQRAESAARRAHELAPANAAIADTYGWILLAGNDVEGATPLLEKAALAMPEDGDIQYHYAVALAGSARRSEAQPILERIISAKSAFGARKDAEKLLADLRGS